MMDCEPEVGNAFDRHAVLVKKPDGTVVGRMPREVAGILNPALQEGRVIRINCIYSGRMVHDGPVVGGGPKLDVLYIIKTERTEHMRIADALHGEGRVAGLDMFL